MLNSTPTDAMEASDNCSNAGAFACEDATTQPNWSPSKPSAPTIEMPNGTSYEQLVHLVPEFLEKQPQKIQTGLPDLPVDILPPAYGNFAAELARQTQTSVTFSTLLILAAIATAVQKKWKVERKDAGHSENLSFWAICIMETGELKTPVFEAVTSPLKAWERKNREAHGSADRTAKAKLGIAKNKLKRLQNGLCEGGVSDEELLRQVVEAEEQVEKLPSARQLWTRDVTAEKLQELLTENEEKMGVFADEGGIIDTLTGLYNNGKANYDVLLQSYSGVGCRVDRQGRSVDLESPALSMGLTVQPRVLKDIAKATGSKASLVDKGFLGRAAMCVPASLVGSRDVRQKFKVSEVTAKKYEEALTELLEFTWNHENNENGDRAPYIVTLEDEAETTWQDFWQYIEDNQGTDGYFVPIGSWTKKLHGLCLRVAALLHIAEHGIGAKDKAITRPTMEKAVRLCRALIPHAFAAFQLAGATEAKNVSEDPQRVLNILLAQRASVLDENDIHKDNAFKNSPKQRVTDALDILANYNILSRQLSVKRLKGKARLVRLVHPSFLEQNRAQK